MKNMQLFEEFEPRDIVDYKGQRARIMSKEGDKFRIVILRGAKELLVDKEDITQPGRCLGRCDRRVIGEGDNRQVYCFGCDRKIMGL